ncbi:hypothetical protein G9P44_002903 [Scheffersomyces stipitis]|nr:hypothetical protein G9P44_002903 [Scheffersomyces stipitis]
MNDLKSMEKIKISSLESLLRFPGYSQLVSDASVLTCGCLASESGFSIDKVNNSGKCPNCNTENVSILSEIKPLRDLFKIVQSLNYQLTSQSSSSFQTSSRRRRSSSKKSVRGGIESAIAEGSSASDSMDFITLFYKFAKEEDQASMPEKPASPDHAKVQPIAIQPGKASADLPVANSSLPSYHNSTSLSPQHNTPNFGLESSFHRAESTFNTNNLIFDESLVKSYSEEKEYNFSKCFPYHRKLSTFATQSSKLHLSFKSGSIIKRNFIGSNIHTYLDFNIGKEVTRFVLITEKKWELYEYVVPISGSDNYGVKPQLICCGKSTGEYGDSSSSLNSFNGAKSATGEIVIKNDFNTSNDGVSTSDSDLKKKLQSWDHLYCRLSKNYLVISGTKGMMRVFNVNRMSPYQFGQPVYTYITNFPIRCIAIAPNDGLVACGITARERLSGKEQPFIILHRLLSSEDNYLHQVDPITITIPYRDPIKIMRFNLTSTHLLCCTAWESRYLVIKLRSTNENGENYRRPRMIWSDTTYKSKRFRSDVEGEDKLAEETADADYELMMTNEGITDLQFGALNSNTVVISSCSLKSRPPVVIRLDGALIDSKKHHTFSDNYSVQNSFNSMEDEEYSSIKAAETVMKISEVGSLIHGFSLSPRGDGIVFLDKDGRLYLIPTPNLSSKSTTSTSGASKKVVILLGEVSNAERFTEAAAIKFSSDGGKIFAVDRKGVFSVFDFTKGVPGEDLDVVKCKILTF